MSKCVAIIPARGGSKRILNKNIKNFFGKPIISYSIENAKNSNLFNRIIVSTDSLEIKKIAEACGAEVPFIRPEHLSDDHATTNSVIEHCLDWLKEQGGVYDYCCTIYATAPLLKTQYLINGFDKLVNSDAKNSFSATEMPFPIQRCFKIVQEDRCQMFSPENYKTRSQDLETAYQDAGQFYWTNLNKKVYNEIMFSEISIPIILPRHLVQDIDTLNDWKMAELMYKISREET